jgi:hypothetical protein
VDIETSGMDDEQPATRGSGPRPLWPQSRGDPRENVSNPIRAAWDGRLLGSSG